MDRGGGGWLTAPPAVPPICCHQTHVDAKNSPQTPNKQQQPDEVDLLLRPGSCVFKTKINYFFSIANVAFPLESRLSLVVTYYNIMFKHCYLKCVIAKLQTVRLISKC